MDITSNKELSEAIDQIIQESGYKKGYIAEQLGISNQNFSRLLNKKHFSLDDANKILNVIGYQASMSIIKKD